MGKVILVVAAVGIVVVIAFNAGKDQSSTSSDSHTSAAYSSPAVDSDEISTITWEEYLSECGTAAQQQNTARAEKYFDEDYKGQLVQWTGTIEKIDNAPLGEGNVVFLKMSPTESELTADVMVAVPADVDILSLNQGETFSFVGRITKQGGAILPHRLKYVGEAE